MFWLSTAILLQAAQPTLPYVGTRKTKVDGAEFRVTIKEDGSMIVAAKSIVIYRNQQRHDRMHIAVRDLTGCDIGDEWWEGTKLRGKLACGAPRAAHPAEPTAPGSVQ